MVVDGLTGPTPGGCAIWYQKHMAHHLLPEMDRAWLARCVNAFLIREPRAMLVSLLEKLDDVRLVDTGLPQQVELFESEARHHTTYVRLAEEFGSRESVRQRLDQLSAKEAEIIADGSDLARMHS